jgi:hypothetical protein
MNSELERIRKKAIVACFKVLYRNYPGGTKENAANIIQDKRCRCRGSNRHLPNKEKKRFCLSQLLQYDNVVRAPTGPKDIRVVFYK